MFAQDQRTKIEQELRAADRRSERRGTASLRLVQEKESRDQAPLNDAFKDAQGVAWVKLLEHVQKSLLEEAKQRQEELWQSVFEKITSAYSKAPFPRKEAVPQPQQPQQTTDERQRWDAYLGQLDRDVASGPPSEAQCRWAREVWARAVEQTPRLRAPAAGMTDEGDYYFDWNYRDLPGLTLSLTFKKGGLLEWFFCDKPNKIVRGTGESIEELPGEVFTYLRIFQR